MTGLSEGPPRDPRAARDGTNGSEPFDDLARALAAGLSRRTAIKLGAGAVVAASVPSWVRPTRALAAHAPATCPAVEKQDCSLLSACIRQVGWTPSCKVAAASGRPIMYNGCGPEKGIDIGRLHGLEPPDHPLGLANFTPGCDAHDCCYGTCTADKSSCDSAFLGSLVAACASNVVTLLSGIGELFCLQIALLYYGAVAGFGSNAFTDAQTQACDCCQPDGSDICAVVSGCNCGQGCCNGECIDIQTDPKNCGGCGVVCTGMACCCPVNTCSQGICTGDGSCVGCC
jgi:hypothetical protein